MYDQDEHAQLVGFASSLVGPQDAEDIVQDYYLKRLNGKVPALRNDGARFSWVLKIVRFTAYHWHRAEVRRPKGPLPPRTPRYVDPCYDDLLDCLAQLRRLSPAQQTLLQRVLQTDYLTAAGELHLTKNQLRGRVYRARRDLKERLA